MNLTNSLLTVNNLSVTLQSEGRSLPIISNINFYINKGETFALVGESGCGKSISSLAITRLLPSNITSYPSGNVLFEGKDLLHIKEKDLRTIRGNDITYVFQEPYSSLNPLQKIREQITEAFLYHNLGSETDAIKKAIYLLERVGITDAKLRLEQYPNQFSGGMLQRVCIAMALMCDPKLLIADEPTSAIDVTIQLQLIELLLDLKKDIGMSVLFISHDIGLVSHITDRIGVMYAGEIIETGTVNEIIDSPKHPYTEALISAYPTKESLGKKLTTIDGIVPSPSAYPIGCRFYDRCKRRMDHCSKSSPKMSLISNTHSLQCFLYTEKPSA